MTSAGIHWLTGGTYLPEDDVLEMVHRLTDGGDFEVLGPKWFYGTRYRTVEGIEVLMDPMNPAEMPPVVVNVPGAGCDFLGAGALRELASILKPSRVDFAWDEVPFSVGDVVGWIEGGQMRTRFRAAKAFPTLMGNEGDGVQLGTRNGTAEVVVYDRRGPVRLEMRLRGERAAAAYEVLAAPVASWSVSFVALLRGLVDFVDRSTASRGDRCPLLSSWESFVSGAERVVVALRGAVAPSFDRARNWTRRQVARTLYMLDRAGVGVRELLREGRGRMRDADWITLHGWQHEAPALTPTA